MGEPFYVGKGKNKRAWVHLNESKKRSHNSLKYHKIRRIFEAGCVPDVVFVATEQCEGQALELERQWISVIGTKWTVQQVPRGPLCNMTSGGEGSVPCEFLRERYARKGADNGMWGKHHTLAAKQKISDYRKTFRHTSKTKERMSAARSNGKNYNTKQWVVILPNGNKRFVDYLKGFCQTEGINYHSLYNTLTTKKPISRGPAAGYRLTCV